MTRCTGPQRVPAPQRVFIETLESRSLLSAVGLFARPSWDAHSGPGAYAHQSAQPLTRFGQDLSNTPQVDDVPAWDNGWRGSGPSDGAAPADGIVAPTPFSFGIAIVTPLEHGDTSIFLVQGQFDHAPQGLWGVRPDMGARWGDPGGEGFSPGLLHAGDWAGSATSVTPGSDGSAGQAMGSSLTIVETEGEGYPQAPSRALPGVVHPDGWFEHGAAVGSEGSSVVMFEIRLSPADSAAAATPSTPSPAITSKEEAAPARAVATQSAPAAQYPPTASVALGQSLPNRRMEFVTTTSTRNPTPAQQLPAITARTVVAAAPSLSVGPATAATGPAPALALVTAVQLPSAESVPLPAPIRAATGLLAAAQIAGDAPSLSVTAAPQEIAAHLAYGFVRLNPGMIFPASVANFVNEWASLSGSDLPGSSSAGAWAVTAAVLGIDAVLLGAWYRRSRRSGQEVRPDPRASYDVHVERFAERWM